MQVIRALTRLDVETVFAIDEVCFPDPWTKEMWQGELARKDVKGLVLETERGIVGFAFTSVLFDEAELPKIAVLPAYRGKGLGQALLTALIEAAKNLGAEKIFLEVRASDVPARKLYERNGFIALRVRSRYYADGEDGIEMKKDLS